MSGSGACPSPLVAAKGGPSLSCLSRSSCLPALLPPPFARSPLPQFWAMVCTVHVDPCHACRCGQLWRPNRTLVIHTDPDPGWDSAGPASGRAMPFWRMQKASVASRKGLPARARTHASGDARVLLSASCAATRPWLGGVAGVLVVMATTPDPVPLPIIPLSPSVIIFSVAPSWASLGQRASSHDTARSS